VILAIGEIGLLNALAARNLRQLGHAHRHARQAQARRAGTD